jgi:hypothetical protein
MGVKQHVQINARWILIQMPYPECSMPMHDRAAPQKAVSPQSMSTKVLYRGYASSLAHCLKAQKRYDGVRPNPQPVWQPALVEPPEALSSNSLAQAVTHTTVQTPMPCHLQQNIHISAVGLQWLPVPSEHDSLNACACCWQFEAVLIWSFDEPSCARCANMGLLSAIMHSLASLRLLSAVMHMLC